MLLFDSDSRFMIVTNTILDYVKLGLLFLLFSIPVITMGAAYTSAMYVGMKIERGEAPTIYGPFWKSFKANFKQATIMTLLCHFFVGLLAFDWYFVMQMEGTALIKVARAVTFFVALFLLMMALYIFPLIARYELMLNQVVRNAVIYTIINFAKNIVAVLILVIGLVIYTYVVELLPVTICVFPALELYYLSRLCTKSFEHISMVKVTE